MVKRKPNVFGSSSDSDSDFEYHKVLNTKRKKRPPTFNTIKNNDISNTGCKNENKEDYMKFSTENPVNDDNERQYDYNTRRFEGMKYDEVQKVKREEALGQSLFTNKHANKSIGLSIMEKMGFKVGDSLGNAGNAGNDEKIVTNPIEVQIKTNRLGIGASNSKHNNHLGPQAEIDVLGYRSRIQQSKITSKHTFMITKAMKMCFQLSGDSEDYYNNEENFNPQEVNILWRPYVIDMIERDLANRFKQKVIRVDEYKEPEPRTSMSSNKENNEDYELYLLSEPLDKLGRLLKYMRDIHNYCFYCGCSFKDPDDLIENCPGIHEEDHLDI